LPDDTRHDHEARGNSRASRFALAAAKIPRFVHPMASPRPSTPTKRSGNSRALAIWLCTLLVVLAAGVVVMLRRARSARETAAWLEKNATSPAGDEQLLAARAVAQYLAKVRAQILEHDAAFRRLEQQKVLSWNVHERSDIEVGRQIVRDFLSTNARLIDTLQYGGDFIRAELVTAKVPDHVRDAALALYGKTQAPLLPLQMRIRRADQSLGENALAVFDLLDFNWGDWHRDEATGRLDFTNTITLATFKDYTAKIQGAADEKDVAQKELVAFQKRRPAP
jgi:hypothetical protein